MNLNYVKYLFEYLLGMVKMNICLFLLYNKILIEYFEVKFVI